MLHTRHALYALLLLVVINTPSLGQIYRWDTGEMIPGTDGITPEPGLDLRYWNEENHNLRFADFSGGLDIQNSRFNGSWLDNSDFSSANITNTYFTYASLSNANMTNANLSYTQFDRAVLTNVDFTNSIITGVFFLKGWGDNPGTGITREQFYSTASYQSHDLQDIAIVNSDMSGWDLQNQNMSDSGFEATDFTNTIITGAIIEGAFFQEINLSSQQLYSTASYQSHSLKEVGFCVQDMKGWDLSNQDLSGCYLAGTDLENTNFSNSSMIGAGIENSDACNSNLSDTDLSNAGFYKTNLTQADFSNAKLSYASFHKSILTDANFTGAIIRGVNWGNDAPVQCPSIISEEQIQSTASYNKHDLRDIDLSWSSIGNWDLSGMDLSGANFEDTTFHFTDLSYSNLTGANFWYFSGDMILRGSDLRGQHDGGDYGPFDIIENTIQFDGHIDSFHLIAEETMPIWDYSGGIEITIDNEMIMDPSSTLKIQIFDEDWGSTITLSEGTITDLDGTLYLNFIHDPDVESLIGTTYDLFNWNGCLTDGDRFDHVVWPWWAEWDISDLYYGGTVTLIAAPEPSSLLVLFSGSLMLRRRRKA